MTYQVLAGSLLGLGLFLLIRALIPGRRDPFASVARIDALRSQQTTFATVAEQAPLKGIDKLKNDLGISLNDFYLRQGWQIRSVRADLAIMDKTVEQFLSIFCLLDEFYGIIRA